MATTDEAPTNADIAQRLTHFGAHIQRWRDEAARLTLLATQSRQRPAGLSELTALEETASAIYADISAFKATVEEVRAKSPAAASELAAASPRSMILSTSMMVTLYQPSRSR